MTRRLLTALGSNARKSQRNLISEVLTAHTGAYPPSIDVLANIIVNAPSFHRATSRLVRGKTPIHAVLRPPKFAPTATFSEIQVPPLPTPGDIAAWLALPIEQLDWFTDERRQHRRTAIPDLQHYGYAFHAKAHGPPRLIEAPKPRLKTMQKRILHDILDHVPTHDASHGFVKGRSCHSAAVLHTEAAVIACFDIANFFLTTSLGRVHALFRSLGYPHASARILTRLCSTATPASVLDQVPRPHKHTRAALQPYNDPHLPQGAPTSPSLANLVARRLDIRLTGLAGSLGGKYSRYADDLTFSGDATFAKKTRSLIAAVTTIVEDEGYALNERKTRIMMPNHRQQITGIVVNTHPNFPRDSFEELKAILHNCRKNGLDAENRNSRPDFRAHLEGRVGWVEALNPARGKRLRSILAAIS